MMEDYIDLQAETVVRCWEDQGITVDDHDAMVADIRAAMRRVVQNMPQEKPFKNSGSF